MLLYLVRHAQTASSQIDSFNGQHELPLTERGQEQARLPRRATSRSEIRRGLPLAPRSHPANRSAGRACFRRQHDHPAGPHRRSLTASGRPTRRRTPKKNGRPILPTGAKTPSTTRPPAAKRRGRSPSARWRRSIRSARSTKTIPRGDFAGPAKLPVLVFSHKATLRIAACARCWECRWENYRRSIVKPGRVRAQPSSSFCKGKRPFRAAVERHLASRAGSGRDDADGTLEFRWVARWLVG